MIVHVTDSQMKVLIQIDFRLGSIIKGLVMVMLRLEKTCVGAY